MFITYFEIKIFYRFVLGNYYQTKQQKSFLSNTCKMAIQKIDIIFQSFTQSIRLWVR